MICIPYRLYIVFHRNMQEALIRDPVRYQVSGVLPVHLIVTVSEGGSCEDHTAPLSPG